MELLQLRYFYESAQNESFAKTAKKFMVPASSVSASVKRLEKELNTNLFERFSNRLKLNSKGYLLAKTLDEIFEKLDNTIAEMEEDSSVIKEISILIKARRKWITNLIIEYKELNPDVRFRISNDFLITDFDNFDIIIDEQCDMYSELEHFPLCVERICIKASKNHPLTGKKLTFAQLNDQPFIMTRKTSGMRRLLENAGKRCGFTPNIAIECNDSYCLLRYVEAGMGLTLGSQQALREKGEKNLTALLVSDFNEVQSVYVYHKRIISENSAVQNFCDFLHLKGDK